MAEQRITGEQLEMAIVQVIKAVDWSKPPESDTVSIGERCRMNDQALRLLIACARQAMKPADEMPEPADPELVDVSMNGDGAEV